MLRDASDKCLVYEKPVQTWAQYLSSDQNVGTNFSWGCIRKGYIYIYRTRGWGPSQPILVQGEGGGGVLTLIFQIF